MGRPLLASPGGDLWRPPAIAGAGGHAQAPTGTRPGLGTAHVARRLRRLGGRRACPQPLAPRINEPNHR